MRRNIKEIRGGTMKTFKGNPRENSRQILENMDKFLEELLQKFRNYPGQTVVNCGSIPENY